MDAFMQKVIEATSASDYDLTYADLLVLQNATTHQERTTVLGKIDGLELDDTFLAEIGRSPSPPGLLAMDMHFQTPT